MTDEEQIAELEELVVAATTEAENQKARAEACEDEVAQLRKELEAAEKRARAETDDRHAKQVRARR